MARSCWERWLSRIFARAERAARDVELQAGELNGVRVSWSKNKWFSRSTRTGCLRSSGRNCRRTRALAGPWRSISRASSTVRGRCAPDRAARRLPYPRIGVRAPPYLWHVIQRLRLAVSDRWRRQDRDPEVAADRVVGGLALSQFSSLVAVRSAPPQRRAGPCGLFGVRATLSQHAGAAAGRAGGPGAAASRRRP